MRTDTLSRLQGWYHSMCNGDWEHTYGVKISNIDNPGWSLTVELRDTPVEDLEFAAISIQRDNEDDWVLCRKDGDTFQGRCGPENLAEMLGIFLDWAES